MNNTWFNVTKINKYIYAIAEFSHWEKVISYLVVDNHKSILIDSGMGYKSIRNIVMKLTEIEPILILTHGHWDHMGGISEFQRVFIYGHPWEIQKIREGFISSDIVELVDESMFSIQFKPKKYQVKGRKDVGMIQDEDEFLYDDFKLQVIHTPGHTPGSICLYIKSLDMIFTGDTIYPGPLYYNQPESNSDDYLASLLKLKKIISRKTVIYPGHNKITCGTEVLSAGISQLNQAKVN